MLDYARIVLDFAKTVLHCALDCARKVVEAWFERVMRWGNRACFLCPKHVVGNKKSDNLGVGASVSAP